MPDTSPRGDNVADDSARSGERRWLYLNATQAPGPRISAADYLRDELPQLIAREFNLSGRCAISGHSHGRHGALVMALKNPGRFVSVSAFAYR